MNLGTLFRKDNQEKLYVDLQKLRESTEAEFMNHFTAAVPDKNVEEMKFGMNGRSKFVYYRMNGEWYSFAWDGKKHQLWAGRQDRNGKWSMIVGYQEQ